MSDTSDSKTSQINDISPVSIMTQRARMVWDERLGLTVAATRQWRTACFLALVIALCAVIGVSYIGAQSKVKPYGVTLRGDEVLPMQPMSQIPQTKLNQLYQQSIRSFIEDSRSVVSDVDAQKRLIMRAYAYLQPQTPAYAQLTQEFKKLSPFERAQSELVKVEVISVLPLTENSFQAEWKEIASDRNGKPLPVKYFKATLITQVIEPQTQQEMSKNPLGFFISSFNDIQVK